MRWSDLYPYPRQPSDGYSDRYSQSVRNGYRQCNGDRDLHTCADAPAQVDRDANKTGANTYLHACCSYH